MASGRGGTTPARGGRLPSCREDIQAESGIHALRFSEQRLALDAVLCGGLIRVKGARLRIRHRLAPLPLAAPRGAAFAAPPASPSPECGIEGIPAAVGRIVRLIEPSVPAGRKASCHLHGGGIVPPRRVAAHTPKGPLGSGSDGHTGDERCNRGDSLPKPPRVLPRLVSALQSVANSTDGDRLSFALRPARPGNPAGPQRAGPKFQSHDETKPPVCRTGAPASFGRRG